MNTLNRAEAAILDLLWPTSLVESDWKTYKGKAAHIERFARAAVTGPEARNLVEGLQRRRLLNDDLNAVTKSGRAALMNSAGLGSVIVAQKLMMSLPLAVQLESWLARWRGEHLSTLLEGSHVPFEMPAKRKPDAMADGLFRLWQVQERSWKILSIVQDACGKDWWIAQTNERNQAIFEANTLLYQAKVLISWQTGRIADISAHDVDDERLAVERALQSPSPARSARSEHASAPLLPKREDVDWEASEDRFRDAFIMPLLRARGLRDVAVRRSSSDSVRGAGRKRKPQRSIGSVSSQDEASTQRALSELARVCCDRDHAEMLLGKAGFPKERMPQFASPLVFWTKVVEEARHGVLKGGALPIIEVVGDLYPNNPVFTEYRSVLAGKQAVASPEPVIDLVGWYSTPFDHRRWVAIQIKRTIGRGEHAGDVSALQRQLSSALAAPIQVGSEELIAEVWMLVGSYVSAAVQSRILDGLSPERRLNVRLFDRGALEALHERAVAEGEERLRT